MLCFFVRAGIAKYTLKQRRIDFKALKRQEAYNIGAPVLIDSTQLQCAGFMFSGLINKNRPGLLSIKRIYLLLSNSYFLSILTF